MGFGDSAGVLEQLLRQCADRRRILYNLSDAKQPDSLPAELKFDAEIVDCESLLFQLFTGARTGADVLCAVQMRLDESARHFGVRRFVYCFDDREYVTDAKRRERALREEARQRSGLRSYRDGVELCTDDDAEHRLVVDCASYRYGLATPLPREYRRVMATPPLRRRAVEFVCELLVTHVVNPTRGAALVTLVVSGRRTPASAGSGATTLRRVFCEGAGAESACIERPACGVGEAEGQAFYWMRDLLASPSVDARRFLVTANDSDTLALALLNMHELYDAGARRLRGALWLNLSSSRAKLKFVDAMRLWRQLKASLCTAGGGSLPAVSATRSDDAEDDADASVVEVSRPSAPAPASARNRHGTGATALRNDIESALVVAMLSGNDYCERMPKLGAGTLFKFFIDALVLPLKRSGGYLVHANRCTGDMLVNERALVALVARAYASMKRVRDLLAAHARDKPRIANWLAGLTKDKMWMCEERRQRVFFDELARCTAAGQWTEAKGQRTIRLPNYDQVRAHARRAFFSLHYYANIAAPARLLSAFERTRAGIPLFGHCRSTSSAGAGSADQLYPLADRVALYCVVHGRDLQPFVASTRQDQLKYLSRKCAGADVDADWRSASAPAELVSPKKRARSATESEQWLDMMERRASHFSLLGRSRPFDGEHGSFIGTPVGARLRKEWGALAPPPQRPASAPTAQTIKLD